MRRKTKLVQLVRQEQGFRRGSGTSGRYLLDSVYWTVSSCCLPDSVEVGCLADTTGVLFGWCKFCQIILTRKQTFVTKTVSGSLIGARDRPDWQLRPVNKMQIELKFV